MSAIEQETSGKSKVSFKVGVEILNLLLWYSDLMFLQG